LTSVGTQSVSEFAGGEDDCDLLATVVDADDDVAADIVLAVEDATVDADESVALAIDADENSGRQFFLHCLMAAGEVV